ncbi:hypothetical protein [Mycolicibacterium hippocampi]|uniref:hypothetical protein n=1 Tax=Mycolicibacterium hippocampi TaxID=659824 RepID=UPI0035164D04
MDLTDLDGFVPLDECAARMGLSINEVIRLAEHRVLRAVNLGLGLILVEPAILSGAVPNSEASAS